MSDIPYTRHLAYTISLIEPTRHEKKHLQVVPGVVYFPKYSIFFITSRRIQLQRSPHPRHLLTVHSKESKTFTLEVLPYQTYNL